ncbi:hypothetical protein PR048_029284 [Dryococelus australis]|uniref:Uncharacterized protein n=1 Tax=Dryococelus australis TaxID=614101 RepID=A0ABQ9GCZ5_9NEOP|nr:hypothetical protein PR048_029284 [Dryococelus australis]
MYRADKHSLTLLLPAYYWLAVKRGVSKEVTSNHGSRRKEQGAGDAAREMAHPDRGPRVGQKARLRGTSPAATPLPPLSKESIQPSIFSLVRQACGVLMRSRSGVTDQLTCLPAPNFSLMASTFPLCLSPPPPTTPQAPCVLQLGGSANQICCNALIPFPRSRIADWATLNTPRDLRRPLTYSYFPYMRQRSAEMCVEASDCAAMPGMFTRAEYAHVVSVYGYCDGNVRGAAAEYPRRWTGRGGPVSWPARSPDLSLLDFFSWGCLNSRAIIDATNQLRNELAGMQWQHATVGYKVSKLIYDQMVHILNSSCETFDMNDMLEVKHVCTEDDFAIGSQFIIHSLDDSEPMANLQGNKSGESCRMMPLVGGFSRGSPVSPALPFRRYSILTSITLIGSHDLDVKSRPNLFTYYALPCIKLNITKANGIGAIVCLHTRIFFNVVNGDTASPTRYATSSARSKPTPDKPLPISQLSERKKERLTCVKRPLVARVVSTFNRASGFFNSDTDFVIRAQTDNTVQKIFQPIKKAGRPYSVLNCT